MAGDDDDRYGSDLRDSPPVRSRSYHRSPDDDGREGSPPDIREGRENGDRYREVVSRNESCVIVLCTRLDPRTVFFWVLLNKSPGSLDTPRA
ncbi:hypothetical protein AXG93_131s1170 [Marchantia polymorpha subsp. ruderalis]|uniref:Uncharacterized protein n=1 Tax=Marchantia polymorpha subsp. ruderalis TaxID=1480154 RepID=A0A176W037_MARPO|nr:hypothetical protein AXG93_131s1170 [Marchantia polymorpha subsp. ruderalis]